MRFDKFTTKFQQAFADAQSLAVGQDNPYIEPQHLLQALLQQEDGGTASLLARAGVNVPALQDRARRRRSSACPRSKARAAKSMFRANCRNLLNLTDKEAQKRGDQFIASEMFLLALTQDKGETGRLLKQQAEHARRSSRRSTRCAAARASAMPKPKAAAKR